MCCAIFARCCVWTQFVEKLSAPVYASFRSMHLGTSGFSTAFTIIVYNSVFLHLNVFMCNHIVCRLNMTWYCIHSPAIQGTCACYNTVLLFTALGTFISSTWVIKVEWQMNNLGWIFKHAHWLLFISVKTSVMVYLLQLACNLWPDFCSVHQHYWIVLTVIFRLQLPQANRVIFLICRHSSV